MSTILKALRRLESDQVEPRRSLREEVMSPTSGGAGRRHRRMGGPAWLALGFALVVGGGVAAVAPLLFTPEEASPPARTERSERFAPLARVEPPARVAPPEPAALRDPTPAEPARAPAAVPDPTLERAVARAPTRAPAPAPAPRAPTPREESRAPSPAAVAVAPRPAPTRAPAPAPEVRVVERPPVPSLHVESTRWHPKAERRLAVIDVEGVDGDRVTLREGDAVGGLVVLRIEPSAVIFRRGDVEIRRRVGD